ncbi:MarR family transcriptional regulator [Brevibacterium casei]|nr:MarR family transcriptional regulator [Brevibacterium casei]
MAESLSGLGSDVELCGLVARLNQRLDSHIRRVADRLGITASQAIAARELGEPMRLTELAEHMSRETSNAGYVVDRMEDQGLVERRPHPQDRRAKLVSLTEAGLHCRANVLDALAVEAPVDALSGEERDALVALLRRATAD